MAAYFLDTSALVNRYVEERASDWVQAVTAPTAANRICVLALSAVELISAIMRRERQGDITSAQRTKMLADFHLHLGNEYVQLDLTQSLVDLACELAQRHRLRAYDAEQLGGALETHGVRAANSLSRLAPLSADDDLNAAADAEGLTVDNLNARP